MITPAQVEKRLVELSKELDEAHTDLIEAENEFHISKAQYEVAMAKSRITNSHPDMKMTATMREDQALLDNELLHTRVALAEAQVKASRANSARLRTQVDITRSVSSSIKSSMDL
jgi:hypothetical protein